MRYIDLRSIVVFGIVGVLITLIHATVVIALIEIGFPYPFLANTFDFGAGFLVSYFRHHQFSSQSGAYHRWTMPQFLTIAGFGLFLTRRLSTPWSIWPGSAIF
ncbi:GtrA family protein [Ruegeria sp. HKCCA5763]|uniref:GtrA family protein n=1 Tax=Ruegeria sp. HKCCA5763 TaxID=2682987 RepID=UPI0014883597|nr:GtrA family protein [Ruegeria sp. HKCCA5763]